MAEEAQGQVTPSDTSTSTAAPAPDTGAAAPGTTAAPGAETATEDGGKKPAATETKERTFTQKELDRIVAKERREYARLIQQAEDRARERLSREGGERQQTQERDTKPAGRPKAADFKDPEDYVEALAEWKFEQREAERARKDRERDAERSTSEASRYIEERFAEADEHFPDLRERLAAKDVSLSDPMLGFVLDHDQGFAVGDFLATNPAESTRIAKLRPAMQILALNEIAAKLKAATRTNTPAPIVPNDAAGASQSDISSEKSDEEWARKREKQLREKRARGD